jgi:putative sigma-54 modulation protein
MRIEVKGRGGTTIDDELLARVEKKLDKIGRQVSPLAELEIELTEERGTSDGDSYVAEAVLHLKGTALRTTKSASDPGRAVNMVAQDLARQVKKHRDKRRGRRESQKAQEPHVA